VTLKPDDSDLASFKDIFARLADQSGLKVPTGIADPLSRHWRELVIWNRKINLTAVTDLDQAVSRHYLDSLALLPAVGNAGSILDVGSGAGFPGLVVAVARPKLRVHLVESAGKKAHFLLHVRRILGCSNVEIHESRLEDLDRALEFDIITGRAAADPKTFAELVKNRLSPGAKLALFIKGADPPVFRGYRLDNSYEYRLPFVDKTRTIATYVIK